MRKRVQVLLMVLAVMAIISGCHGLGVTSETYVNSKDANQVLEFTSKGTVKGLVSGRLVTPQGHYTLRTDQKVTGGDYRRVDSIEHPAGAEAFAYVLNLDQNKELKMWPLVGESSLRDEAGGVWQFQSRSHEWRSSGPEETIAPHLRALK